MSSDDLRADMKRRGVMRAARKHFMREGYAGTGMEAVARDASVSTATLYSFFPSKAELFQAVIAESADDFSRMMREVPPSAGDGAVDQLRAFARAYGRFMSDPFVRSVFRLVAAERRRFAPTARYFFERGRADFGAVLIGVLTRLHEEGRLNLHKPSWAAGQLMGMIEHPTFMVPMVTGDETRAERSVEQICDDAVETFLARYGLPQG